MINYNMFCLNRQIFKKKKNAFNTDIITIMTRNTSELRGREKNDGIYDHYSISNINI